MARKGLRPSSLANVPWLTKDGGIDFGALPIEPIMKQALNKDENLFRSACQVLASMSRAGRKEAGIFLYGLMRLCRADMARKEFIVDAVATLKTKEAVEVLFAELDEIKSSNTTRGYIKALLKALAGLPLRHTEAGFQRLLEQDKWSYKMKRKFQAILDGVDWRYL